jgi:hypothetical protein
MPRRLVEFRVFGLMLQAAKAGTGDPSGSGLPMNGEKPLELPDGLKHTPPCRHRSLLAESVWLSTS